MMYNIVFWWLMVTVVLFMVGAIGLRLFWDAIKLMCVIAFGCAVLFIAGG